MKRQNIVEWFNVRDDSHLTAYRFMTKTGCWPKGFIPSHVEITEGWNYSIAAKIANAWIDYRIDPENTIPLVVDICDEEITISTADGLEVVHWTYDEWSEEDTTVIIAIANAIKMAYCEPDKLVEMNIKHINSQKEINEIQD